jgi:hypothetical protein
MTINIPTPGQVFNTAKSTVDNAIDGANAIMAIPGRILKILDDVELVLRSFASLAQTSEHVVTAVAKPTEEVLGTTTAMVKQAEETLSHFKEREPHLSGGIFSHDAAPQQRTKKTQKQEKTQ